MIVCMYECMYGLIDGRMDVCMCMYVTAMHISQESRKHKQHQCILSNHRNIPWILQQVFHWGRKKRNWHFVRNVFHMFCLENFYINVFEKRRQLALSEILSGSPGIQHISPKIQPGHQRSGILMFHSIPPLGVSSRGHADKTNSGLMLSDSQADMTAE